MNWLIGRNKQQEPETPVHRWAINAFKAALVSDSPLQPPTLISPDATPTAGQPMQPEQVTLEKRPRASSTASILKTSGVLKEQRKSVTFQQESKPLAKPGKTGLPQTFPGKFPSPWTPMVKDLDTAEEEEMDASPSVTTRDQARLRFGSKPPLPAVPVFTQTQSTTRAATPARPKPQLKWTVDRGFEELLAGFTRNNQTLQQMIAEMQASCTDAQAEARATTAAIGSIDSDATLTLDAPRSQSGQFWKRKFESLCSLSETIQAEQGIMQQMLLRLRQEVDVRVERTTTELHDKCTLLREELDRERRAAKALPSVREARGLRQRIKELEQQLVDQQTLEDKLAASEMRVTALQAQLKAAEQADKQVQTISSPIASKQTQTQSALPMPVSATAKRLAQAAHEVQDLSKPMPPLLLTQDRSLQPSPRVWIGRGHFRGASKDKAVAEVKPTGRGSVLASRRQAIQQAKGPDMTMPALRGLSDPSLSPPVVPLYVLADQGPSIVVQDCKRPVRQTLGVMDVNSTLPSSGTPTKLKFESTVKEMDPAQRRREAAQRRLDERRRAQAKSSFGTDVSIAPYLARLSSNKENM